MTSEIMVSASSFDVEISTLRLGKVITIDVGDSVYNSLKLMKDRKVGALAIVRSEKLVGILTERDILTKVAGYLVNWEEVRIGDVMTEDPQVLHHSDSIVFALNNMHVGGYRHIPIIGDNSRVCNMLSIKDIVSWICEHFPTQLINITSEPFRGKRDRDIGG